MSDATHTPGPWQMVVGASGRPRGIRAEYGKNVINWRGISMPTSAEGMANARLIAAAPDMLAALRMADEALSASIPRCAHYAEPMSRHMSAQLAVRAAIAKAEGREA